MDKLIWYWNLLYYHICLWYEFIYKLFTYIDPFTYLFKIPQVQKFYAKRGIKDINAFASNVVYNDKKHGMNSVWAGIQMGGLLVIIEYAFFNLYQAIVGQSYIQFIWIEPLYRYLFCIALIIVPGFINYYVLFKHDRYLIYFH